ALEVAFAEGDGPAEAALVRRDRAVVLDPADDEAALDPEEVERRHPDHAHPLRLPGVDERVPELERPRLLDPELVAELRGVAEPGHEDGDSGDRDVLAESVVGEDLVREVLLGQALEDL